MTQTRSAPSMTIGFIAVFIVGLLLGYFVSRIVIPPEDNCSSDLETCVASLESCRDSLSGDPGFSSCLDSDITIVSVLKDDANIFMDRYKRHWDHETTREFMGMNIHCAHLLMIEKYLTDHPTAKPEGYRIYMGLREFPMDKGPDSSHIIHLIYPVSSEGTADMSESNALMYDPPGHFELPCPTFCDASH